MTNASTSASDLRRPEASAPSTTNEGLTTNNIPVEIPAPVCALCHGNLEGTAGQSGTLELSFVHSSMTSYVGTMDVEIHANSTTYIAYSRSVTLNANVAQEFSIPEGSAWDWDDVTKAVILLDPSA